MVENSTVSGVTAEYRIRPLLKKDQRVVAAMLGKLADQFDGDSIREIISSAREMGGSTTDESNGDTQRARIVQVFFGIFRRCMVHLTADVDLWFADLLGVTPEQYEQLPVDIDLQVLNQLKEAPEVDRFFTGALRLFSATGWSASLLSRVKGLYGSVTDSVRQASSS